MPAGRPRVLVTGFGRFPGMPSNPSADLAGELARSPRLPDAALEARLLPTRWDEAAAFAATLDRLAPDVVLMLGVAARRRQVCVEVIAHNATGAFPDAARCHPPSHRLTPEGPARRPLSATAAPLLRALHEAGVPARRSRDAGRYVCNALAWSAYGWAEAGPRADGGPRLAVFVHVPLPRPGRLSRLRLLRALEGLLRALLAQYHATQPRS